MACKTKSGFHPWGCVQGSKSKVKMVMRRSLEPATRIISIVLVLTSVAILNFSRSFQSMRVSHIHQPRPSVVPFTEFEKSQHLNMRRPSFFRNVTSWNPTVAVEKNVFFVWIGPHPIPDRAIVGIASAAIVYGAEWTVHVVTTGDAPNLWQRIEGILVDHKCTTENASTIKHLRVALKNDVLQGLGWAKDEVELAEAIFAKGGKENIVTISDLVRAVMIYTHGGVYLDVDTIVGHKVIRPTIGVKCKGEETCHPDADGILVMQGLFPDCRITCMINGFFAFQRGHKLLGHYLDQMRHHLEFDKWGVLGPALFFRTLDYARREQPHWLFDVNAVSVIFLICLYYNDVNECTNYSYLSSGQVDGDLPRTAVLFFQESVAKHCINP